MRILALGGAGDMGRTAVTTLVNSPDIESITVADYNIKLAEKFVGLSHHVLALFQKMRIFKEKRQQGQTYQSQQNLDKKVGKQRNAKAPPCRLQILCGQIALNGHLIRSGGTDIPDKEH